ncbi:DNA polymerase IV [Oceanidesulfovibrio indonesiensis]|uniref:DNA polymerase IV n=2 Tax=Oceanidesulfovibrio indonesiensis TaxID=54767 RepID=A0A7M3MBU2_9BACT|nr:DNA polymerase IV [Oceanidesulfovibrio indonesiensis]
MHVDMDAFFASVEVLDDPSLAGKPVIVGGRERGVVSAASYEARKYGVHSAMPSATARRLCPHGVFVKPRGHRYGELSDIVMQTLANFSPILEKASVDEAYLDVSGTEKLFGPPAELARKVKEAVREATGGLTCSLGIAPIKFLAKIASDVNKPDGVFIIEAHEVAGFLKTLPIGDIPGVGKRGRDALAKIGVITAGDVTRYSEEFWITRFGKWGSVLYDRAQGLDPRGVTTYRAPKSEGAETTFAKDIWDKAELKRILWGLCENVGRRLRRDNNLGRTVTLKLKDVDFRNITRSRTLDEPINTDERIYKTAADLLDKERLTKKIRLIGVTVSNFQQTSYQLKLDLDGEREKSRRYEVIDKTVDEIRAKYGREGLVRGRSLGGSKAAADDQD